MFCAPPQETAVGVSFVRQGYKAPDYSRARDRALRQLAWGRQVRIQGEQLAEQLATGDLALRGNNIRLLDVPEVDPEACRMETLVVEGRAWIAARPEGGRRPSWGQWGDFSRDPPEWIEDLPEDEDWLYARGISEAPFRDEAEGWEWALYSAVVDLAGSVALRVRVSDRSVEHAVLGAAVHAVDTELKGVRVAARWRDAGHLYVLVRVPAAGAVSLLQER